MDLKLANHLERLKAIFNEAGIHFQDEITKEERITGYVKRKVTNADGLEMEPIDWPTKVLVDTTTLTVYGGYSGFYTVYEFDEYGKLAEVGAYEY
jgi:hypothetical protein